MRKVLGVLVTLVVFSMTLGQLGHTTPSGLKIPEVPITGGKKLAHSKDGQVAGVEAVPGIKAPKIISWQELTTKNYDLTRNIPSPHAEELSSTRGMLKKRIVKTVDLPKVMKTFTQLTFTEAPYNAKEEWVQSFGNIINEFKQVKGNFKKTDALLTQLKTQYPAIYEKLTPYLQQLVRDDFLYSSKWDPYKDESVKGLDNDGILFVDQWYPRPDPARNISWNQNIDEHNVYQGATIIYADVKTIKEMEKDYASYFDQVGQHYLEVYPVPGSYNRGVDANGNDFLNLELFLRNALPFPYSSCSYVMKILERYTNEGVLVSEYYSEDKNDLNWMAGRDTYYPIKTTKGELVGNMLVTTLDFDIKNVPERDIDRIVGMKAGLGNMKRISEKLLEHKNLSVSK